MDSIIIEEYKSGMSSLKLAKKYGCSKRKVLNPSKTTIMASTIKRARKITFRNCSKCSQKVILPLSTPVKTTLSYYHQS